MLVILKCYGKYFVKLMLYNRFLKLIFYSFRLSLSVVKICFIFIVFCTVLSYQQRFLLWMLAPTEVTFSLCRRLLRIHIGSVFDREPILLCSGWSSSSCSSESHQISWWSLKFFILNISELSQTSTRQTYSVTGATCICRIGWTFSAPMSVCCGWYIMPRHWHSWLCRVCLVDPILVEIRWSLIVILPRLIKL